MTATILALAAASFFGIGLVLTQFGLRYVAPLSGAALSIPSFTLLFIAASPFLLRHETVVWSAAPIFAAVGLVFPAMITMLTFAGNRALGPVVTGALGNLAPLFAVTLAVILLHEPLSPFQFAGLIVIVAGVVAITVTRPQDMRNWRSWALLLPLGAAAIRGFIQPVIKLGLEEWPSPIAAGFVGYIFSSLTVLVGAKLYSGRFIADAPVRGIVWFIGIGLVNGVATLLLYAALGNGPVALVAPLVATYPLMTVVLSALILGKSERGVRLALAVALTVGGVVLLLVG